MADREPLGELANTSFNLMEIPIESPPIPSKNDNKPITDDGNKENPITQLTAPTSRPIVRKSILRDFDPLYSQSPVKEYKSKIQTVPENDDEDNANDLEKCVDESSEDTILEVLADILSKLNINDSSSSEDTDVTLTCDKSAIFSENITDNSSVCATEISSTTLIGNTSTSTPNLSGLDDTNVLIPCVSGHTSVVTESLSSTLIGNTSTSTAKLSGLADINVLIPGVSGHTSVVTESLSPILVGNTSTSTANLSGLDPINVVIPENIESALKLSPDTKIDYSVFALSYSIISALLQSKQVNVQQQLDIKTDETFVNIDETKRVKTSTIEDKDTPKKNLPAENLYNICDKAMSDLTDVVNLQEQDIHELKLQLNQSQQARASLELQLRQKEEMIIKTQAESQKKEQLFRQEMKQLQDKVNAKDNIKTQDARLRDLEDAATTRKAAEEKLMMQVKLMDAEKEQFIYVLEEYEKTFKTQLEELDSIKHEYGTAKHHLANMEIAFSDVHQKYERLKTVVEGYKNNEVTLCEDVQQYQDAIRKHEERYETLKAHAKAQIEKFNSELIQSKEKYDMDVTKLNAIIKRLQLKLDSVTNSLNQKTKECEGLAELCDEVTGKVH